MENFDPFQPLEHHTAQAHHEAQKKNFILSYVRCFCHNLYLSTGDPIFRIMFELFVVLDKMSRSGVPNWVNEKSYRNRHPGERIVGFGTPIFSYNIAGDIDKIAEKHACFKLFKSIQAENFTPPEPQPHPHGFSSNSMPIPIVYPSYTPQVKSYPPQYSIPDIENEANIVEVEDSRECQPMHTRSDSSTYELNGNSTKLSDVAILEAISSAQHQPLQQLQSSAHSSPSSLHQTSQTSSPRCSIVGENSPNSSDVPITEVSPRTSPIYGVSPLADECNMNKPRSNSSSPDVLFMDVNKKDGCDLERRMSPDVGTPPRSIVRETPLMRPDPQTPPLNPEPENYGVTDPTGNLDLENRREVQMVAEKPLNVHLTTDRDLPMNPQPVSNPQRYVSEEELKERRKWAKIYYSMGGDFESPMSPTPVNTDVIARDFGNAAINGADVNTPTSPPMSPAPADVNGMASSSGSTTINVANVDTQTDTLDKKLSEKIRMKKNQETTKKRRTSESEEFEDDPPVKPLKRRTAEIYRTPEDFEETLDQTGDLDGLDGKNEVYTPTNKQLMRKRKWAENKEKMKSGVLHVVSNKWRQTGISIGGASTSSRVLENDGNYESMNMTINNVPPIRELTGQMTAEQISENQNSSPAHSSFKSTNKPISFSFFNNKSKEEEKRRHQLGQNEMNRRSREELSDSDSDDM